MLPGMFDSGMVLQQGVVAPVWGWADPGKAINVAIAGQSHTARADTDGRWRLTLDPLPPGGPFEMEVRGDGEITLTDVLVGEVWLCSGQSNMQWWVGVSENAEAEIRDANHDRIRLLTAPMASSVEPKRDVDVSWQVCRPDTVRGFSAAAYYFGRCLHRELNTPIGLIHSSWGGTAAEAWMSREALASNPEFQPILDRFGEEVARYPDLLSRYDVYHAEWAVAFKAFQMERGRWLEEYETAKSEGRTLTSPPPVPPDLPAHFNTPAGLYGAMIHPFIPYAIRGVIWYQGEANIERAYQYRELFPALVGQWRKDWGQGDFPFLFVQLANWQPPEGHPTLGAWAELREAQLMAVQSTPNTGMAVTIDIGDAADIHPRNKQEVGARLARIALAKVYDRNVVFSGPLYRSMSSESGAIRLHFDHTSGGLIAKGGGELTGFSVAGEDRRFVPARATIDGNTVVALSNEVGYPVAVRYAWEDNPVCNLYNGEGLPASPFRTDAWPGHTVGNR